MDYFDIAKAAVHDHAALQKAGELAPFLEFMDGLLPKVIVEIGCDAGGTLWAWQQLGPELLIGVDKRLDVYGTARPRVDHGATILDGDSHDMETAGRLKRLLGGRKIDLLFIDGDHTYNGVRQDFQLYGQAVAKGGVVAFHDICHHKHHPEVGVERFWRQLAGVVKSEIMTPSLDWGGIGWLRR